MRARKNLKINKKKQYDYLFEIKLYTHNVTTQKMIAANFIDKKIDTTRAISFKDDNDERAIEVHKLIADKIDSYIKSLVVDLNHDKNVLVSTNH